MTEQHRTALKELQELDIQIQETKQKISAFDPKFEEVEEPALILESELNTARKRLQEMKLEERRLELSVEEKSGRRERLDERLGSVRNLREEAAVSAELEMIKRALQGDEQEALSILDQIRKTEERLVELEETFAEAQELVEPQRQALLAERDELKGAMEALRSERESFTSEMDPTELRMYEAIRSGGRRMAVADLTEDGACGSCFGIVPLQLQNEIRHNDVLIRCEGCGVILAAPDPAAVAAAAEAAEAAEAAAAAEAVAAAEAAAAEAEAEAEEEATTETPVEAAEAAEG
jgi:predicted  nucleic acid-binding Zn-ribbon protein